MSDLVEVLPDFDIKPYRHLTFSLEKNGITVSDLLTLDAIEIAKRCPLPLGDLKSLMRAVVKALHDQVIPVAKEQGTSSEILGLSSSKDVIQSSSIRESVMARPVVKTLDPAIDLCLGGGFCTRHITEIVGESAVGKTQFALSLLLSCQLPPPHGLGRSAIYLSTESPLNTARLVQMLSSNPHYQDLPEEDRPTLDRIHTMATNNLESQEHIIQYQLPIAVQRFNVGLVVMDSVAANFRAEHETRTAKGLADRAVELMKLGNMLRKIARENDLAVVVTNQVSDRFDDVRTMQDRIRSSSPIMSSPSTQQHHQQQHRMQPPPPSSSANIAYSHSHSNEATTLDHQQRFFTGWGDNPNQIQTQSEQLKNPALGLAWANQLSARVVLKMESERLFLLNNHNYNGGNIYKDKKKKRYLSLVFAPWFAPSPRSTSGAGFIEYEIQLRGPVSTSKVEKEGIRDEYGDLLDPDLWSDGEGDVDGEGNVIEEKKKDRRGGQVR